MFSNVAARSRRNLFKSPEWPSRDDHARFSTLRSPRFSAPARPGTTMSTKTASFPQVFPTWAELAAAAKAGDARARDFLLTFVPWMSALHDDKKPKN
jgi:hypothetical protein